MVIDGVNMLPGMAEYPRNQWYVAGWSHEFSRDKALARDICGEPVALYRSESGEPRAVFNRCPHRGTMLYGDRSGNVGKSIICSYHSWQFDTDGSCKAIPLDKGYQGTRLSPGHPDCQIKRAARVANSACRADARDSSNVATLAHAIRSTSAELAIRTRSALARSPTSERCNWVTNVAAGT